MLRWLYIRLLWAHPAEFRYRFCDDMLDIFDRAVDFSDRLRLLIDGIISVLRQWILRPEFRHPATAAAASGAAYDVLTFQQIEPYKPSRVALAQGGLLAILLIAGVVNAINHGGGKLRNILIGAHRAGFGLIRVSRESMEGGPLHTAVDTGLGRDDPWRPFARSYFKMIRVLSVLDTDGNLSLSHWEVADAPHALRRLDANHDGKLSPEECGFEMPGKSAADPQLIARFRLAFMRNNPVLAALDTDRNGEISEVEIATSIAALWSLDFTRDAALTPDELLPHPAVSEAAGMMTRFDMTDSGVLAVQELAKGDGSSLRGLWSIADRNHDGLVTRGELLVALAYPEILRRQWEEQCHCIQ